MSHTSIELIGVMAGCLGLVAWLPQLHTVYVKRLHAGIDIRTLGIILTALIIWCVYGVLREAWAVCLSNICSGAVVSSIIHKVIRLRK